MHPPSRKISAPLAPLAPLTTRNTHKGFYKIYEFLISVILSTTAMWQCSIARASTGCPFFESSRAYKFR